MRSAPLLIGAFIVIPILGAVTGASIDTTIIRQGNDTLGNLSRQSIGGKGNYRPEPKPAERMSDSYAMETEDGQVELAELSTYGVGRSRRDAAMEFAELALAPLSDAEIEQITAEALAPLPPSNLPRSSRSTREAAMAAADAAREAAAASRRRYRSVRRRSQDTKPLYPAMPDVTRPAESYPSAPDNDTPDPALNPVY